MTKEEIAEDLVKRMKYECITIDELQAKECAIVCAEEIKKRMPLNQEGYWNDIIEIIKDE
jgi:hypothetical protein